MSLRHLEFRMAPRHLPPVGSAARRRRVRFALESGHLQCTSACPLWAISGTHAVQQKYSLFDHLVGAGDERLRKGEAEHFCGLEI
jgi:hypothetical protein